MTILLLGGRGKTASRIASLIHAANLPFLVASRSTSPTSPYHQAYFDWTKEDSYESPFIKASTEGMAPISTVYLVPPPMIDLAPPIIHFVDFARQRGVKRFVLLSDSTVGKGGPTTGQVHEYLDSLKGIEYAVLRPTWFMGTFLFSFYPWGRHHHLSGSQKTSIIPTSSNELPLRMRARSIQRLGMVGSHLSPWMMLLGWDFTP